MGENPSVRPFEIRVPDADLADLSHRLDQTRLGAAPAAEAWQSGVDYDHLARVVDYWRTAFRWRHQEGWLNSFPQYQARLGENLVHFVRIQPDLSRYPNPMPVVLSHGWPYTFIEYLPLALLLTDPSHHGIKSKSGFEVVIPSLPGYGYSSPLVGEPFTSHAVAHLWHRLMTEVLGYEGFITYGEDVGTGVSDWLGVLFPDRVRGIFTTHPAYPPADRRKDLTDRETQFLQFLEDKWRTGQGYSEIQSTRPDTLAVGLQDSPTGLLAWVLEKFHEWSGPGYEEVWTEDDILTTTSLYWFTKTIGTSFLPYFHSHYERPIPQVSVPVGVSVHWGERGFPREYAERTYLDIRTWKELSEGGHFTAKQTPELVAADMAAFADLLS